MVGFNYYSFFHLLNSTKSGEVWKNENVTSFWKRFNSSAYTHFKHIFKHCALCFHFSVANGKYVDDTKYIHAVNIIDDGKYGPPSCHLEDPTLKPSHYGAPSSCQPAPGDDSESLGLVKSEDASGVGGSGTNGYVLPPFLRWSKCCRQNVLNKLCRTSESFVSRQQQQQQRRKAT